MSLQPILCGWYMYTAVLSFLLALSAGPRTRIGMLGGLAGLISLLMVPELFTGYGASLTLGAKFYVLVIALISLFFSKRTDTRMIALLLLVAAVFPLFLHFCTVNGRGVSCAFG